ncbi:FAD/NAD(P)-binding domain-containing protein [Calocera viscosa TUFC12733]|uniref:FAD/NAD(P)-binding domain-containing protein n=1 Tax=Calocera viscosa (strain TUFC12733) TaxID=1330018 RepID=A0A167FMR1_CALVF|nr:FAD/NAD(P)-binding domain-containing protein [Calocera viscosa TUFC12733]
MPLNRSPRIAVVGAGPAGLTFASVLLHQLSTAPTAFTPNITLFERVSARASRDQGGSLDIHGPTGQRALRLAGLWDEFLKVARYEGEEMKILDKTGRVWWYDDGNHDPPGEGSEGGPGGPPGEADGRPEIDRGILNGLLIDSLPASAIQWGKAVTALERSASDAHKLTFSDGSSAEFDLVIGGDGAWSKTRRLLTPVVPHYSGVTMIEVRLSGVDSRIPHIGAFVGQGSLMACSDNKGMFVQRNSGERVRVYFSIRCTETWQKDCGIDWNSLAAARVGIRALFADWDGALLDLLDRCDDGIAVRPLYMLPPDDFRWPHARGVTLIGDSAHLMTPFAGEGVNMAMADGMELAEALLDAFKAPNEDPLDSAVKAYEKKMYPRAEEVMKDTWQSLNAFMNPDAPQSGLSFFAAMLPPGTMPEFE